MISSPIFAQPLVILLFSLALGFFLGGIRPRFFNSTLATLLVSIAINLALKAVGVPIAIPDALKSMGFAFFSFSIGFSAGPGFADAIRSDGKSAILKQTALALTYCVFAGLGAVAIIRIFGGESEGGIRGLLAGALTQTTILDQVPKGDAFASVAYGVSYPMGMIAIILFVQSVAPALLGLKLTNAVKNHLDGKDLVVERNGVNLPIKVPQIRAYRVKNAAKKDGLTVESIEALGRNRFEIVAVHPGGGEAQPGLSQGTSVQPGDVIVAIGDIRAFGELLTQGFEEIADERFLSAGFVFKDIVLAEDKTDILSELTARGIFLRSAVRDGRILSEDQYSSFHAGDVLSVAGLEDYVKKFVGQYGYVRDDGAASDLFALTLAVAVAIVLGAISLGGVSLGSGCCSLMLGLALGCLNGRRPDIAHIPSSALSLMRSLGLNIFIGSVALGAALTPGVVFSFQTLTLVFQSLLIAIVPLFGTFAIGQYVLRLSPVTLLGGLCGCGTCTAALNALEDAAKSSAFTAAYTVPYVIGNILLTLLGGVVAGVFH